MTLFTNGKLDRPWRGGGKKAPHFLSLCAVFCHVCSLCERASCTRRFRVKILIRKPKNYAYFSNMDKSTISLKQENWLLI